MASLFYNIKQNQIFIIGLMINFLSGEEISCAQGLALVSGSVPTSSQKQESEREKVKLGTN